MTMLKQEKIEVLTSIFFWLKLVVVNRLQGRHSSFVHAFISWGAARKKRTERERTRGALCEERSAFPFIFRTPFSAPRPK